MNATLDTTRIRALCFDVDGTLSDTDDLYVARLSGWLSKVLPLPRAHTLARWLVMKAESPGNALYTLFDRFGLDDSLYRLVSRRAPQREYDDFRPVPGVPAMLAQLSEHYPLAVVSARGEYSTLQFLEKCGLRQYFQVVVTAQTCKRTKPTAEPLLWAAEHLKVPPQACVMIGDTVVDIRTGQAAGAQTIGVLCGFGEREELVRAGANLILSQTAEVPSALGIQSSEA